MEIHLRKIKKHCRFIILNLWMLIFSLQPAFSQQEKILNDHDFSHTNSYGINLSGLTTTSGLGLNLNTSFFYRFHKNIFAIGPNFQSNTMNLTGLQAYYQRELNLYIYQLKLYYQIHVLYQHNAMLGPTSNDQYRNIYGSELNFKHQALEEYMGLGVRKPLSDHICFDSSIGIGAYHMLNASQRPNQVPFKSENDLSFMLKIGLTYDFKY
jgi:hypothetical protein